MRGERPGNQSPADKRCAQNGDKTRNREKETRSPNDRQKDVGGLVDLSREVQMEKAIPEHDMCDPCGSQMRVVHRQD